MTRKQYRLAIIAGIGGFLAVALALIFVVLGTSTSLFLTPSQLGAYQLKPGDQFKIGGLVEIGSCQRGNQGLSFNIIDNEGGLLRANFNGIVPDLFREGQGVVATGAMTEQGDFEAKQVLARHDESYIPREIADKIKQEGQWRIDEDKAQQIQNVAVLQSRCR